MRIGVPAEIKIHEYRVGLMPASVRELTLAGHAVTVQSGAGLGVGCSDDDYRAAGAQLAPDAASVHFTSALAVQLLKVLQPELKPLIDEPAEPVLVGSSRP